MEMITAFSKPSDVKICKRCNKINWYENKYCADPDCTSHDFVEDAESVTKVLESVYKFYMKEMLMSKEEVDHILIKV